MVSRVNTHSALAPVARDAAHGHFLVFVAALSVDRLGRSLPAVVNMQ